MRAIIIWILFLLGVSAFLASCSEAKKLQKAEQRVLANRESVDRVGRVWSDLHPCVPDSVVKYLPGRIDTSLVVRTDTVVTKDTVYITRTIEKTRTTRDTIQIAVKDTRERDLLLSDIEKLKTNTSVKDIQIAQLQADTTVYKAKASRMMWLFIIAVAAFAVYVFRKPILSLITKIP